MAGQRRYQDTEKLVRALRVVRTWAALAKERHAGVDPVVLVDLCDKTLNEWDKNQEVGFNGK